MKPRLEIRFPMRQQRDYWFGEPYEPKHGEFLLNHARSGIMLALQALDLPAGSHVGVMAYNCHTVFNAIAQAGYSPLFLDITDALKLDIDDLGRKRDSINALLITHLFGIVNDVEDIRNTYPDLPIIEDCAHAFGIPDCHGDFSVFSIGQGKFPSLGDGGILKVNDDSYIEATANLYEGLPVCQNRSIPIWARMVIKSWLYSPCIYTSVIQPLKKRRKTASGVEAITPRRMVEGISAMYNAEEQRMPEAVAQRKRSALTTDTILSTTPGVKQVLEGSINGFMSVALCDDLPMAKKALREKGIEADTHFKHCIDWAKSFGYTEESCPNTESLTHRLLMVPTY